MWDIDEKDRQKYKKRWMDSLVSKVEKKVLCKSYIPKKYWDCYDLTTYSKGDYVWVFLQDREVAWSEFQHWLYSTFTAFDNEDSLLIHIDI